MATNNMLKFYRLGAEAMATKTVAVGAIWFNTDDNTIQIKTATGWEKYAGKLNNATWDADKKKLTISKYDGSSIELDFSDIASGASVSAALNALETKLQNNIDGANAAAKAADDKAVAAQGDVDALEEVVGTGFSKDSTVSAQLAAVKATADAAAVKATVDAELAKKADAEQVAKDIAAAKSGAEATAAADATSKANAAEAAAKGHADGLNTSMDARVKVLEAAIGEDGSVEDTIAAKIEDLDADVTSAEGTQVRVQVVEVDGKITEVKVTESATFATVQALADEIADRAADEEAIADRIALLDAAETGRVSVLEKQVSALNAATHFEGKVEGETFEDAVAASDKTFEAGDIVIYKTKEYIFDGTNWIELGDTTAEQNRLTALENLVGSTSVDGQIDAKIGALDATVGEAVVADGKHVAVQVVEVDGVLTALTVSENDIASAAKLTEIEGEVDLNTAAVADHKTRIETLEATSNALGTTYVKVSDYNSDKQAFEQKHTDLQGEIDDAEGRLDTAEADIDGVQEDVANLQAGTGLADGVSAPVYTGSNYLGSATTMVAADMALDAKIKEVADSVTSKNVSAEGDAYVSASASNNKVTVAAVTGTVESKSGLATNQGVYDALCWVEFE